jgi:alpha-tubulin suppressor-like RCC1 family protein
MGREYIWASSGSDRGIEHVKAIAAWANHTVALKSDGSVISWGDDTYGQCSGPLSAHEAFAIAASGYRTIGLVHPAAPRLITEPTDQVVNVGQRANLAVSAVGYPLNFQWQKDGSNIVGAIRPILDLGPSEPGQAGAYHVLVSNPLGSVTSAPSAVLIVNPAPPGSVVVADTFDNLQRVPVQAQSGVISIAPGSYHALALKADGSLIA